MTQSWSLDLANKLLKEAPLSMPLIEVFALALEAERERWAVMADADHADIGGTGEYSDGYRAACENHAAWIRQGKDGWK